MLKSISIIFFFKLDERNELLHNLYWANEQKCQNYTNRIGLYFFFHMSGLIMVFIHALYCIAIGNYDTSSWSLPISMISPCDPTRLFGWFISWATQFGIAVAYSLSMISITAYFVSCCFYIITMCDHFNLIMNDVKADVKCNQMEKNPREITKNRLKITKQLSHAIKLHTNIFEYVCHTRITLPQNQKAHFRSMFFVICAYFEEFANYWQTSTAAEYFFYFHSMLL